MSEQKVQVQEKKWYKITKLCVNVVFYALIVVLLLFSIANLNKKEEFDVPSIFGKGFTTVQTPSMEGTQKDSFTVDDLVFLNVLNNRNHDKKVSKLEVGDIITFEGYNESIQKFILNTHRIMDIVEYNGKTLFITQGDRIAEMNDDYKYSREDDWDPEVGLLNDRCELVNADDVKAIYSGKWVGAGKAFKFIQTSNGFLLCIVLPIAVFFVVELLIVILNFMKIKQGKREEEHAVEMEKMRQEQQRLLEEEKARIRAEILAEQARKQEEEENNNN